MQVKILRPGEISSQGRQHLFVSTLIHWFRRFGRDLPWRRTRNPYKILISEIMLQQTQVDRVIGFYHNFLGAFPTIEDLANANEEQVLKCWDGLGYYNRARNLHKSAKIICEQYNGEFPKTVDMLEKLPGIGKYTAGAIVSFAFIKPVPIVDTNVKRVLERNFVRRKHTSPTKQNNRIWKLAADILPPRMVWEFNQALMDFGAKICTAKRPKCHTCPMRSFCFEYERRKKTDDDYLTEQNHSHGKAAEPYVPYSPDLNH